MKSKLEVILTVTEEDEMEQDIKNLESYNKYISESKIKSLIFGLSSVFSILFLVHYFNDCKDIIVSILFILNVIFLVFFAIYVAIFSEGIEVLNNSESLSTYNSSQIKAFKCLKDKKVYFIGLSDSQEVIVEDEDSNIINIHYDKLTFNTEGKDFLKITTDETEFSMSRVVGYLG